MKFRVRILSVACLVFVSAALAATDWEALGKRWWAHVQFLADDKLEGRNVGTPGFERAAAYVTEQFKNAGLQPAGVNGFAQPVEFNVARTNESESSITIILDGKTQQLQLGEDAFFSPHANGTGEITAPALFAGYGLRVAELNYDDFAGLDAK